MSVLGLEEESGKSLVGEWMDGPVWVLGPGGFSKISESYSLGKTAGQNLSRMQSSIHCRCSCYPLLPWKITHHQCWPPTNRCSMALQNSEDSKALHCRICPGRLPCTVLQVLSILFLFKQRLKYDVLFFLFGNAPAAHLHGCHGNYQVASSWAWSWGCQQESQYSSILFLPGLIF